MAWGALEDIAKGTSSFVANMDRSAPFEAEPVSIPISEPEPIEQLEPEDYLIDPMRQARQADIETDNMTPEERVAMASRIQATSDLYDLTPDEVVAQRLHEVKATDEHLRMALDDRAEAYKGYFWSTLQRDRALSSFSQAVTQKDYKGMEEARLWYMNVMEDFASLPKTEGVGWINSLKEILGSMASGAIPAAKMGGVGAAAGAAATAASGGLAWPTIFAGAGAGAATGFAHSTFHVHRGGQILDKVERGIDLDVAVYSSNVSALVLSGLEVATPFAAGKLLFKAPGLKQAMGKTGTQLTKIIEDRFVSAGIKGLGVTATEVSTEAIQTAVEIVDLHFTSILSDNIRGTDISRDDIMSIKEGVIETIKKVGPGMLILGGLGAGVNLTASTINRRADERIERKAREAIEAQQPDPEPVDPKEHPVGTTASPKVMEDGSTADSAPLTSEEILEKQSGQEAPIVDPNKFDQTVDRMAAGEITTAELDKIVADDYAEANSTGDVYADFVEWTRQVLPKRQAKTAEALVGARARATGRSRKQFLEDHNLKFRKSEDPRYEGAVEFMRDGNTIFRAFENTTLRGVVHEIGHIFRKDLNAQELTQAEKAFGVKEGIWDEVAEENFANGFLEYMATGEAPTGTLKRIFDNFNRWLANVAYTVDTERPLNPQMRQVFDTMLSPHMNQDYVHNIAVARQDDQVLYSRRPERVQLTIKDEEGNVVRQQAFVDQESAAEWAENNYENYEYEIGPYVEEEAQESLLKPSELPLPGDERLWDPARVAEIEARMDEYMAGIDAAIAARKGGVETEAELEAREDKLLEDIRQTLTETGIPELTPEAMEAATTAPRVADLPANTESVAAPPQAKPKPRVLKRKKGEERGVALHPLGEEQVKETVELASTEQKKLDNLVSKLHEYASEPDLTANELDKVRDVIEDVGEVVEKVAEAKQEATTAPVVEEQVAPPGKEYYIEVIDVDLETGVQGASTGFRGNTVSEITAKIEKVKGDESYAVMEPVVVPKGAAVASVKKAAEDYQDQVKTNKDSSAKINKEVEKATTPNDPKEEVKVEKKPDPVVYKKAPTRARRAIENEASTKIALKQALRNAVKARKAGHIAGYNRAKAEYESILERQANQRKNIKNKSVMRNKIKRRVKSLKPYKTRTRLPKGKYVASFQDQANALVRAFSLSPKAAKAVLEGMDTPHNELDTLGQLERQLLRMRSQFRSMSVDELNTLYEDLGKFKDRGVQLRNEKMNALQTQIEAIKRYAIKAAHAIATRRGLNPIEANAYDENMFYFRRKIGQAIAYTTLDLHTMSEMIDMGSDAPVNRGMMSEFTETIDEEGRRDDGIRLAKREYRDAAAGIFGIKGKTPEQIQRRVRYYFKEEERSPREHLFDLKEYDDNGVEIRRTAIKLNRPEARNLYAELQMKEVYQGMEARGFTADHYAILQNFLTEADFQFVDFLIGFYDRYYNRINEVYREKNATDLIRVESYVPITRITTEAPTVSHIEDILSEVKKGSQVAIGSRHFMARVPNNLLTMRTSDIAKLEHYIRQMEHYMAFADWETRMRSLFNDETFTQAVTTAHGRDFMRYFSEAVDDVITFGSKSENYGKINRAAANMRGRLAIAFTGMKPIQLFKQLASTAVYWRRVPAIDLAKGLADFAVNPKERYNFLKERSALIRNRYAMMERDFTHAQNSTATIRVAKFIDNPKFMDLMTVFTRMGDLGAIVAGGWAHYKYLTEVEGKSEADAIREMEIFSRNTQQSAQIGSLTPSQRSSEMMKAFTMFTKSQQQYAGVAYIAWQSMLNSRMTPVEAARAGIIMMVAVPVIWQVVASAGSTDEDSLKDYILSILASPFDHWPVLNLLWNGFNNFLFKGHNYGRGIIDITAAAPIEDFGRDFQKIITADDFTTEEMFRAVDAVGTLLNYGGIPWNTLVKEGKGVYDLSQGELLQGTLEIMGVSPYKAERYEFFD